MNNLATSRSRVGLIILIALQVLSFFCIFPAMWQLGFYNPETALIWLISISLAIVFPVMTSHFHALCLSKRIGWVSWWFWITNAMIVGLWIYSFCRTDREYYDEDVTTFFFCVVVGGTLGGLIVFGLVRRFAPRWLGYKPPQAEIPKRGLSLKTLFFWLTSIGVICGSMVNGENLGLRVWDRSDIHVAASVLAGAFLCGLFCMFVFLPVTSWLRFAKPSWLAVLTLMVVGGLTPLVIVGYLTITFMERGSHIEQLTIAYSFILASLGLIAAFWLQACHWAGLIHVPPVASNRKPWRKAFAGLGWCLKHFGFAITFLSIAYAIGWCCVHFSGGPERNPDLIRVAIIESLGGTDMDEDWIEIVNREWSQGVTKENNLAIKILQVSNPFEYRLIDPVVEYGRKMGLSREELEAMPRISPWDWLEERNEKFHAELLETFPDLDIENFDDYPMEEDIDERESINEEQSKATPGPSRERILAEVFYYHGIKDVANVPWTAADYPIGKEFIDYVHPHVIRLRELSKEEHFYSPLVRQTDGFVFRPGDQLLDDAVLILEISAMYHTGSGDIAQAIEDYEALLRFSSPQISRQTLFGPWVYVHGTGFPHWRANHTAKTIANSPHASLEQVKHLLHLQLKQPDLMTVVEPDFGLYAAFMHDEISARLNSPGRGIANWNAEDDGILRKCYKSFPELIDWKSFDSSIEQSNVDIIDSFRMLSDGSLDFGEAEQRQFDVYANSAGDYFTFGRELLTFIRGPKTKGRFLAEIYGMFRFNTSILYSRKAHQAMDEIAIALVIYQRSNGDYPESLEQLVPAILPRLKPDPFTGDDFVYLRKKESFLLYALGYDMADSGGDLESDMVYERPVMDLVDLIEPQSILD